MTENTSPDLQAILASYEPTEAPFNIPETADLDVEDEPDKTYRSSHVSYSSVMRQFPESSSPFFDPDADDAETKSGSRGQVHPVILEPSSRTVKVVHKDIAPIISNAGVRGMVTNVSHGTFNSQPASLIVFSFSLRSGDHLFRFKNANFKITFAKHPSAPSAELSPAVRKFAPRKIFGLPTVEGRRNRIGGEVSLQVPAGPLTVGPTIGGERESEYEKEHRFKTIGNYWSSKHGIDWDIVYWDMKENRRTKHGIPDRLNVAVVVEREGSFTASAEVTVDTPVNSGLFAFPWPKNSPVAFAPEVVMGEQPRTRKFEELTDMDWRKMIPYEDEWENKLTEETMRSGGHTPSLGTADQVDAQVDGIALSPGGVGNEIIVRSLEIEESDDR